MKTILRYMVIFLIFMMKPLYAGNDVIVVDRMFLSNAVMKNFFNKLSDRDNIKVVSTQDYVLVYVASLRVFNPTKKIYDVEFICVDEDGNPFFKKLSKTSFSSSLNKVGRDVIKGGLLFLKLDPSIDTMVKGQIKKLKISHYYFIKLYVDKKLIGITSYRFVN